MQTIKLLNCSPKQVESKITAGVKKTSKSVRSKKHITFKTILDFILLIVKIGQKIDPKMISNFILKVNIFFKNHHLL